MFVFFSGFPDDFDLGINSQIPGATWEWLNQNKSFITIPEDFHELMETVKLVNEAIEDMSNVMDQGIEVLGHTESTRARNEPDVLTNED